MYSSRVMTPGCRILSSMEFSCSAFHNQKVQKSAVTQMVSSWAIRKRSSVSNECSTVTEITVLFSPIISTCSELCFIGGLCSEISVKLPASAFSPDCSWSIYISTDVHNGRTAFISVTGMQQALKGKTPFLICSSFSEFWEKWTWTSDNIQLQYVK